MVRALMIGSMVAVLAACGSGDTGDTVDDGAAEAVTTTVGAADPEPEATDTTPPQAPTTAAPSADEGGGGLGLELPENTAVLTVGDETWTFDTTPGNGIQQCNPDFFDMFLLVGWLDETGQNVLQLLVGGEDAPRSPEIAANVDEGTRWVSGEHADFAPDAGAEILSFEQSGLEARATAMFINSDAPAPYEPVEGTVEIVCAPEQ